MTAAEIKSVLVCDLVDSTRLVHQLGDVGAAELFRRHDAMARALTQAHEGREIDKTDGFLLLFDRPISAVQFAVAYHGGLETMAREQGVPLSARVGIHLGEVVLTPNSPALVAKGAKPLDVEGLAKVVAARLMSLAGPRQTLLSRAAFDVARRSTVGSATAAPLEWRIHGSYVIKGVEDALDVCEAGAAGQAPFTAPGDSEKARRVAAPTRPGILVVPFDERSAAEDVGHISVGLADEVITSLAAIDAIRVIARGAAMRFKGTERDLRTIGRELGVAFILQGSVERSGDKLRIMAQLLKTDADDVLWARKFTGGVGDLFEIEETIARAVADALQLQLSAAEAGKMSRRPIPNAAAYEYYLRARREIYSFTGEGLDRALEFLQKGLAILGDNIQLHAAMGGVYFQYVNAGVRPDPAYLEKARECANRILALDADSPEGHRLIGLVDVLTKGDVQEAVRHLKRALAGDPNDTDTLFWLAAIYGFAGHGSSARARAERLIEIDPVTPLHHVMPALVAVLDSDLARAVPLALKAHEVDPANPAVTQLYGQALMMSGRAAEATAVFDALSREAPDTFFAKLGQCYVHAHAGNAEGVRATATQDVLEAAAADPQYAWALAECFAVAGDVEQGMVWLTNATNSGNWNYPLLAEKDPLLARLRGHEQFAPLMALIKPKWQAFEV